MKKTPQILTFLLLATAFVQPTFAAEPASLSLEQSFAQLKTYDAGQSTAPLVAVEAAVGRGSADAARRPELAARLATLLSEPALSASAKLFVCQQLRLVAGKAQVPVLAKMLDDTQSADMARLILQVLPGEAAGQALVAALDHAKGLALIGIVNSLGARREVGAIKPLARLLVDPDAKAAGAAALALGRIGNAEAAAALNPAKPEIARLATFKEARLIAAQRLTAAGEKKPAEAICRDLLADNPPPQLRLAALSGLVNATGKDALPQLAEAIQTGDATLAAAAIEWTRQLHSPAAIAALQASLTKSEGATRLLLLGSLAELGDEPALQELTQLASSTDAVVRTAAARETQRLRSAASPEVLARLGTAAEPDEGATALSPLPYPATAIEQRRQQITSGLAKGDQLLAYLDCGVETSAQGNAGVGLHQLNGQGWSYPGADAVAAAPLSTVAFDGTELRFEISGLNPEKHYALGLTWWDYDNNGRSQSVSLSGGQPRQTETVLKETKLPNYVAARQPASTITLPVAAKFLGTGKVRVAIQRRAAANAVVNELWVIETQPGSPAEQPSVVTAGVAAPAKPAPVVDLTAPAEGTKVLIVTGDDYPGHPWQQTAPALKAILDKDPRLKVRIVEDPNALASPKLQDWDAVIIHFMDWEKPGPGPAARENLKRFVESGKGMMLTHFACGAWDGNEWPEFKNLAGRVWDPKLRGHDPHGKFTVEIADPEHPITKGMQPFETLDELYTCLAGEAPIHIVAKANSKVDKKDYPIAFVLNYGQGRVFHSVLGHDARAYAAPGVGELMRRGCAWAAGVPPQPSPSN